MDKNNHEGLIFDVTTSDFEQRVIRRSREVPVLVDFWATWCGPCRALAPVLAQAVSEQEGRVLLAKVDTDREPGLAQTYKVRGIPAVKAFRDGRVVDEFVGARDLKMVRAFIERVVPSERGRIVEEARAHLRAAEWAEAEALLRRLPDAELGDAVALLAEAVLGQGAGRLPEVGPLLDRIDPRSPAFEHGEMLRERLEFYRAAEEAGGEAAARQALAADPSSKEARYALAAALAMRGGHREALDHLLDLVARDRRFRDDGARRAILAIFKVLGAEHEITQEYRRRLQVLL